MKKHVFFQRLLIFVISVAMIFSLTSCAQRKPIPTPSKEKKQEQNKPPKELDELSKAVEKLEKTLTEMHERSKKPLFIQQSEIQKQAAKDKKDQQQGQQQEQGQSSQGQQDQQKQGGSSGSGQQQGQQPSQIEIVKPEERLVETQYELQQMKLEVERANLEQFEQLKKDVIELHSMWNAFEAKAVNQFLMQSSLLDFETALNDLTKSIENNDVYQALMDIVQLYKYLPDFYIAYASESPPEIAKIRYGAKKIVLLAEKSKYPEAMDTLDYMMDVWLLTRPRIPKDSIDLTNQFEFSISDLKDAVSAKNPMVVKAKTEVMLKVLDEIEKESKKKAEQK